MSDNNKYFSDVSTNNSADAIRVAPLYAFFNIHMKNHLKAYRVFMGHYIMCQLQSDLGDKTNLRIPLHRQDIFHRSLNK